MNEKITKPSRVRNVYLKDDLIAVIDFVKEKYSTEYVKINDPEAMRIIIRHFRDTKMNKPVETINEVVEGNSTDNVI